MRSASPPRTLPLLKPQPSPHPPTYQPTLTCRPRPCLQYIDTGSVKPLFDICGYGFVGSYIFSWPREYAHVKAEQEAKLKGQAAKH